MVLYAAPCGPIKVETNNAYDAVVGNPPRDVATAKLALAAKELLNGIPSGKNLNGI